LVHAQLNLAEFNLH